LVRSVRVTHPLTLVNAAPRSGREIPTQDLAAVSLRPDDGSSRTTNYAASVVRAEALMLVVRTFHLRIVADLTPQTWAIR
jgi:hypothetical protein